MRTTAKRVARRLGLEIGRWPYSSPEYALHQAMMQQNPDVVLDVGANHGTFGQACRAFGYTGDMVSFEPAPQAFAALADTVRDDPRWTAERLALSDAPGQATLHVTDNNAESSSLLPMLEQHRRAAPDVHVVGTERVSVSTLDDYLETRLWRRIALKLDVQGAERHSLDGAARSLPRIPAIRLECSLVHLYDGDWLWDDVGEWMREHGYRLAGVAPGFRDRSTGVPQQFDAVFVSAS